jgi:hypothetical protein
LGGANAMYDNVTFYAYPNDLKINVQTKSLTKPFRYRGIVFTPCYYQNEQENGILSVKHYQGKFKNCNIKIKGAELIIENSIHKLLHGNNYSLMTYSDLVEITNMLLDYFELSETEMYVRGFEFGLNIPVDMPAIDLIKNFHSYKKQEFCILKRKGTLYGKKALLDEYNVKVYDKSLQVYKCENIKLNKNILRIELDLNHKRKRHGILTVKDMVDPKKLELLYNDLIKAYSEINKKPMLNHNSIPKKQFELLYAGDNPDYWKAKKAIDPKNHETQRRNFRQLKKANNQVEIYAKIETKIKAIFNKVMGN